MRRPVIIISVFVGILLFLAISLTLARAFNAESTERTAITDLVRAEARGDLRGATSQLTDCAGNAACRARIAANVTALHRGGKVEVLQLESSTGFSLGSTLGNARIAFCVGGALPTVQCVRVRRAGNVISGLRVELLSVSRPLKGDAACGPSGP